MSKKEEDVVLKLKKTIFGMLVDTQAFAETMRKAISDVEEGKEDAKTVMVGMKVVLAMFLTDVIEKAKNVREEFNGFENDFNVVIKEEKDGKTKSV